MGTLIKTDLYWAEVNVRFCYRQQRGRISFPAKWFVGPFKGRAEAVHWEDTFHSEVLDMEDTYRKYDLTIQYGMARIVEYTQFSPPDGYQVDPLRWDPIRAARQIGAIIMRSVFHPGGFPASAVGIPLPAG